MTPNRKLPRLRGATPEAVALWATLCAERVELDAACASKAGEPTLAAFLSGVSSGHRTVAKRILRLLATRSLIASSRGDTVTMSADHYERLRARAARADEIVAPAPTKEPT